MRFLSHSQPWQLFLALVRLKLEGGVEDAEAAAPDPAEKSSSEPRVTGRRLFACGGAVVISNGDLARAWDSHSFGDGGRVGGGSGVGEDAGKS